MITVIMLKIIFETNTSLINANNLPLIHICTIFAVDSEEYHLINEWD